MHPPEEIPTTPLGPDDVDQTVSVRKPMFGVTRFSKRVWVMIYVGGAVLFLLIFYGLGLFGSSKSQQGASPFTSASPPSLATPASESTAAPSQIALGGLPTAPPKTGAAGSNANIGVGASPGSSSSKSADDLSKALAAASSQSTPAPFAPSPGSGYPNQPPVQVPQPGGGTGTGATGTQQQARPNAFYIGDNNSGQNSGAQTSSSSVQSTPTPAPTTAPVATNLLPAYLTSSAIPPLSRYELWSGSLISAQLDTGLNSDLPGPAIAHVVGDVYDSRSGRYLLIPKGSRLIGVYSSITTISQARIAVSWNELIWPDGRKINLQSMPGADTEGNAGLYADVNTHRGSIITTTIITGLLAGLGALSQGQQGQLMTIDPVTGQSVALQPSAGSIIASNLAQSTQKTGQDIIQQKLSQPPTLTVPKGERFLVILDRTIVLMPYVAGDYPK